MLKGGRTIQGKKRVGEKREHVNQKRIRPIMKRSLTSASCEKDE